jgi:dephospho-CoA kinase
MTGNIACGKSTAAEYFEKLGCYTIDADQISRIVMSRGQEAYEKIVELFGSSVVSDNGELDRSAIRKVVFDDPEMRKKLEGIVHPAILEYERKQVGKIKGRDDKAVIITHAALTVESGSYKRFDGLIVVYIDPEVQLRRLMERDKLSEDDALKIIRAQMPIEEKIKYAQYIIDNSKDTAHLEKEVERVFDLIKMQKYGMKNS